MTSKTLHISYDDSEDMFLSSFDNTLKSTLNTMLKTAQRYKIMIN